MKLVKLVKEAFVPGRMNAALIYISYMVWIPLFPATILLHINIKKTEDSFLLSHYTFLINWFWRILLLFYALIFVTFTVLSVAFLFFAFKDGQYSSYAKILDNFLPDSLEKIAYFINIPLVLWSEIQLFSGFYYLIRGLAHPKPDTLWL